MALEVATAAAIMKKTYADGIVPIDYKKSKTLAMMKKRKGTVIQSSYGESFSIPIKHGNPQAGSATYATGYGQASAEQSRYKAWTVTPATVWHFADVKGDIVRRGASVGSFVDALTSEIENAKAALTRIIEIILFKGGWGDLARLSATANVASATGVAMLNPWMVRHVETGMKVVFAASEAGHVLKGATAAKVVGRHAAAGTLDFNIAPNTAGTAAAVSDFMFREGDREDSATPTRRMPTGFKAWLPTSAPSATLFHGVDRTIDDRLGGLRHDFTTSGAIEEGFMDAAALVDGEGGEITHFVTGTETYNKLAKSMAGKVQFVEQETDVGVVVRGLRINGQDAMIYPDSACEEGITYGYNIEDIEIRYAGKDLCYLEEEDGLPFRRVAGEDTWRSELVTCWNFILPAPGHAVVGFNI